MQRYTQLPTHYLAQHHAFSQQHARCRSLVAHELAAKPLLYAQLCCTFSGACETKISLLMGAVVGLH